MKHSNLKFRIIAGFFLAALMTLAASPASGQELQDDLKVRRARVMERLGPEAVLILRSAPVKVYSGDVDYEFRQDSNLFYLTGIDQEETILVLMPGNQERKEILFVKPRDPVREHWEGRLLSRDEATDQSGIETVYQTTDFESFIAAIFSGRPYAAPAASQEYARFASALKEDRARLHLLLTPGPGVSGELPPNYQFVNKLRERFFGFTASDATSIFRDLRQMKSPYEQKILEESGNISSEAHLAGMKAARPGAYEYEVEAAIEYVFKKNGAFDWSYPSIVGSGPNSTTLHYSKSNRKMQAGDLLLVDAAAHHKYVTVDVTRTYPVSGTFTPAQKDIYSLVFQAQTEAMSVAGAGARLSDVHQKTVQVIKQGLLKLGLITDTTGDQYRLWYTHSASHWIGMDVHDVGDFNRPLSPGMAFVIEPGIYIRESALDNLPDTRENADFIEKVRPAVEKYRDIGVRIEDSFLLSESGLKNLSAKVPRTIGEIETFMKSR
jgi:Xaa-Pro aminopeptidase